MTTVRFRYGLKPLVKHGSHDQRTHGSWANGTTSEVVGSDTPESMRGKNVSEASLGKNYRNAGFRESLDFDEKLAIDSYLRSGHNINSTIRSGRELSDRAKEDMARLDDMIEKAPSLNGDRLYRTTSAEAVERLKVGDVIQDKGYMSTTVKNLVEPTNGKLLLALSTVSSGRKSIIRIDGNYKKSGLYMPAVKPSDPTADFEREVLLPRNTKMRYKGFIMYPFGENQAVQVHNFERLP